MHRGVVVSLSLSEYLSRGTEPDAVTSQSALFLDDHPTVLFKPDTVAPLSDGGILTQGFEPRQVCVTLTISM